MIQCNILSYTVANAKCSSTERMILFFVTCFTTKKISVIMYNYVASSLDCI